MAPQRRTGRENKSPAAIELPLTDHNMKHFSDNKKNRGFTLVELTVVMVLLSLVGIIAVSVTLMATRAGRNFRLDAETSSELLEVEASFKDWLMQRDGLTAVITVSPSSLSSLTPRPDNYFTFADGVLTYTATDGTEKRTEFGSVTGMRFSRAGKTICCEVTVRDLGPCKFLYTMRAATVEEA